MRKKITIIGEIHGVKQNISVYKDMLSRLFLIYDKQNIAFCLELEDSFNYEDGRFSIETQDFLKWLQEENIDFHKIGVLHKNLNTRENLIAQKISEISSKYEHVVCILGRVHANKEPIEINGEKIDTAGFILKKDSQVIFIDYKDGQTYNFGIKEIKNLNNLNNFSFDEIIVVEKATPITPIHNIF